MTDKTETPASDAATPATTQPTEPVETEDTPMTEPKAAAPDPKVAASGDRAASRRRRPTPAPDTEAVATRAREAERDRVSTIYDLAGRLNLERGFAEDLVKRGVSVDESRRLILDQVAAKSDETRTFPPCLRPARRPGRAHHPPRRGGERAAAPLQPDAVPAGGRRAPVPRHDAAGTGPRKPRQCRGQHAGPVARRGGDAGAALDLGLPRDPVGGHQQDPAAGLRGLSPHLHAVLPPGAGHRLQGDAPGPARRSAAAAGGRRERRVQARDARREQGELQGQDLWPGGRDHPPDADQRRSRRLHPDPGDVRQLHRAAGVGRGLGHHHRQPGDGRRQRAVPHHPQEPRGHRRGARCRAAWARRARRWPSRRASTRRRC